MHWLTPWERLYIHFRKGGVPEVVLKTICISPQEAEQIGAIILKTRPHTILEIGTFLGLSTGVIALTMGQDSQLVCVDPDLPIKSLSAEFGYPEERGSLSFVRAMLTHFNVAQRTVLLRGFFSHLSDWAHDQIVAFGGNPAQTPIIGEEIGQYAPYDLVFLDGDHHTDAVAADLALIAPYLASNGIIVLHDMSHGWGEQVRAGVAQFIQSHPGFSLKIDQNLGLLDPQTRREPASSVLARVSPQRPPTFAEKLRWKLLRLAYGAN